MDIELLRTFLEVKNTRHFGRASENLFLTQAAVSSRIRQLESMLGMPLFIRHRNNIQLTASGERLIQHAESILENWHRAKTDLQSIPGHMKTISIGTTPGLWDAFLSSRIEPIYNEIPDIAIRADVQSSEQLTRRLIERELDLALVYDPPKNEDLISHTIFTMSLIPVSSQPNSEESEMLEQNYIKLDWGTIGNSQQNIALPNTPTPILQTSQVSLAIHYLLTQGGFCYLPEKLVAPHLNQKNLFQLKKAPIIERDVHITLRKDYLQQALFEQIIHLITPQP